MRKCTAKQSLILVIVLILCATAVAQPVTLIDEQVIRPIDGPDEIVPRYAGGFESAKLSPDGNVLLYKVRTDREKINISNDSPAQLILLHLDSLAAGKRVEFRLDVGKPTVVDLSEVATFEPFSPDGKVFVVPWCVGPAPKGPVTPRHLLIGQSATGELKPSEIHADQRYGRIDSSSRFYVYDNGEVYSLETGKAVGKLGFRGGAICANPVVPLMIVMPPADRGGPMEIVWNLRTDRLAAKLPAHPQIRAHPVWTSDGVHLYFLDMVGPWEKEKPRVTRVWSAKTGEVVGKPLQEAEPVAPGPTPNTMILRERRFNPQRWIMHDLQSGAVAQIPIEFNDVLAVRGSKIVYWRLVDETPMMCIATLQWGPPGNAAKRAPATARIRGR